MEVGVKRARTEKVVRKKRGTGKRRETKKRRGEEE